MLTIQTTPSQLPIFSCVMFSNEYSQYSICNMVHNLDVTLCILFVVREVTSFNDVTGRVMCGSVILVQSTETAIMLIHDAV